MSRNACTNRSSIVLMSFEKNPMRFFSFSLLCVVGAEPRLRVIRARKLVVSNVPGRRSVPRLQAPHSRNSHTQFRGIPSGRCEIGTTGNFSFRQMTDSQFSGAALYGARRRQEGLSSRERASTQRRRQKSFQQARRRRGGAKLLCARCRFAPVE